MCPCHPSPVPMPQVLRLTAPSPPGFYMASWGSDSGAKCLSTEPSLQTPLSLIFPSHASIHPRLSALHPFPLLSLYSISPNLSPLLSHWSLAPRGNPWASILHLRLRAYPCTQRDSGTGSLRLKVPLSLLAPSSCLLTAERSGNMRKNPLHQQALVSEKMKPRERALLLKSSN